MRTSFFAVAAAAIALAVGGCIARQSVKAIESGQGKKGKIQYEGGDGQSIENAVVIIGAKDQKEGVAAEHRFISNIYGERNKGWRLSAQSILRDGDKVFDMIEIVEIADGSPHFYYFDITHCTWKPRETPKAEPEREESP